jgi:hypothetical protein
MRLSLLACLLVCIPVTGCRRVVTSSASSSTSPSAPNTLVEGTFITGDGNWHNRQGNTARELTVNHNGNNVSWNLNLATYMPNGGRSSGGSGSSMQVPSGGGAWFIYVESPDRLWFFNGKDQLVLQQASGYNTEPLTAISRGKLESEAAGQVPAELIPRLPADLQALFPMPSAPVVRPSI